MSKLTIQEVFEYPQQYPFAIEQEVIIQALNFAQKAHKGQLRKSGEPYITHPIQVSRILSELEADQATLIAGLLHDTVEDTQITLEDVEQKFGKEVAILVDGVTKLASNIENFPIKTLKKVLSFTIKDPRVLLIKLADRLHNMQTICYLNKKKQRKIAKQTLDVYVPLAYLIGVKDIHDLLEDICMEIVHPELYSKIKKKFSTETILIKNMLFEVPTAIYEQTNEQSIECTINEYKPNILEIARKIEFHPEKIRTMQPEIHFNIVCKSKTDCYALLGIIHSIFHPISGTFGDHIAIPENTYQYLFTSTMAKNGVITHFRIWTKKMKKQAQVSIAHPMMKDESKEWIGEIESALDTYKYDNAFIQKLQLNALEQSISVFAHTGEIYTLPHNATVLDFAFAISTINGLYFKQAWIKEAIVPPHQTINAGEIITIKNEKNITARQEWLAWVETKKAKNYILQWLSKSPQQEKVRRGKFILAQKFETLGQTLHIPINILEKIFDIYEIDTKEQLYERIGDGKISVNQIIQLLYPLHSQERLQWLPKVIRKIIPNHPIELVTVSIFVSDEVGLFNKILEKTAKLGINVKFIRMKNFWSNKNKKTMKLQLEINNIKQLQRFFDEVKQLHNIIDIKKTSQLKYTFTWSIFIINTLLWILQYAIHFFTTTTVPLWILIFAMLFSIAATFYLNLLSQHMILHIHSRARLLNMFLITNISIIFIISAEKFQQNIEISWLAIISFGIVLLGLTITEWYQYNFHHENALSK